MSYRFSVFIAVAFLFAGCAREPPQIVLSGPTMGTNYSVKVAHAPASVDRRVIQATIDEVLERVDRQMSGYRSDSEVSRFNNAISTDWFEVSADVVKVVDEAQAVAAATQGALDITVAPLVGLWGFGLAGEPHVVPADELVDATKARTGYRKLTTRMQPPALRKDIPELTLDLNSVAPGFATDLLFERLAGLGLQNLMVDIGGEVRARGRNGAGDTWRIAVEKPVDAEPEAYAILRLDDMAVTTSGEYRHSYERDGQRYSHTIDPRSGRPVQHLLASVAVVSATALQADAWSTALNVLGEEAGYELAVQRNIPALFIVGEGAKWRTRMTPALHEFLASPPQDE